MNEKSAYKGSGVGSYARVCNALSSHTLSNEKKRKGKKCLEKREEENGGKVEQKERKKRGRHIVIEEKGEDH